MKKQTELFNLGDYSRRTLVGDWAVDVAEEEPQYIPAPISSPSPQSAKNDSLTSSESVSESPPKGVSESTPSPSINKYYAGGKARTHSAYYRLTYRDGKRVHHLHIPGGAVGNPLVEKRIATIRRAIGSKMNLVDILEIIGKWKGKKP